MIWKDLSMSLTRIRDVPCREDQFKDSRDGAPVLGRTAWVIRCEVR